jgi:hypothetical protein
MTRPWTSHGVGRALVVMFVASAMVTGCTSEGSCAAGRLPVVGVLTASASCAAGVEYGGRFYQQLSAKLRVARGHALGDAVYPACNGGCEDTEAKGRPTRVWAMRGVDTTEIVVGHMEGSDRLVVFARPGADPKDHFRFRGGAWHLVRDGSGR